MITAHRSNPPARTVRRLTAVERPHTSTESALSGYAARRRRPRLQCVLRVWKKERVNPAAESDCVRTRCLEEGYRDERPDRGRGLTGYAAGPVGSVLPD